MYEDAVDHLQAADPVLAKLIARAGPCTFKPDPRRSPYQSLVQAVAHQQLNGKAAATILGRFLALFPNHRFPPPEAVGAMDETLLRGCGFSRAKVSYIRDVAHQTIAGIVPTRTVIERMTDDAIVERLTQVKGIGRWSVEMFLMFGLGRMDVLPVHDFGVRNGFKLAYRKRLLPTPEAVAKHGERWRPYRTIAAWYLWRAVDM